MNDLKEKGLKFIVPFELKNDIVYCQRSLRTYIHMHQILTSRLNPDDLRIKDLEKEIIDIGKEQKTIIDNLRLNMETYFLELESSDIQVDRQKINQQISRSLAKYYAAKCDHIEPLNVRNRCNEFELFDKYIYSKNVYGNFNKFACKNVENSTAEEMEVLVSPQDMIFMTSNSSSSNNVNGQTTTSSKSQVSLLKPKSERAGAGGGGSLSRSTTEPLLQSSAAAITKPSAPAKISAAVNNSRMNLLQALKKAKNEKIANQAQAAAAAAAAAVVQQSIRVPTIIQKSKYSYNASSSLLAQQSSSSAASSSSSAVVKNENPQQRTTKIPSPVISPQPSVSSESDGIDLPEEDPEPLVLGKEAFLRVVGLCTQTYKEYIMSRRSERKRRHVTSTERGDFHYGKLELFERQSSKNSKRQMLLSPTRTSRKTNNSANAANNAMSTLSLLSTGSSGGASSSLTSSSIINSNNSSSSIAISSLGSNVKRAKSLSPPTINKRGLNLVCMVCLKQTNEPLKLCETCSGAYHKMCHKRYHRLRERYCPHCMRLNTSQKDKIPIIIKQQLYNETTTTINSTTPILMTTTSNNFFRGERPNN